MGNAPKHPDQSRDLRRWDDDGGTPRHGHHFSELHVRRRVTDKPALYYFNVRTGDGLIEDPEGNVHTSLQAAREAALVLARDLIAEGGRDGVDRRNWSVEIMDRANRHTLAVAFSEARDPSIRNHLKAE